MIGHTNTSSTFLYLHQIDKIDQEFGRKLLTWLLKQERPVRPPGARSRRCLCASLCNSFVDLMSTVKGEKLINNTSLPTHSLPPLTFNKIRISQSSTLTSIFWDSRGISVLRYTAFAIYYFRIISPSTFQYYCKPCLDLKFLKCAGLQGRL